MKRVCAAALLVAASAFAEGPARLHNVDVPLAEPVTLSYPESWVLEDITPPAALGQHVPPALKFTTPDDKEFWIRVVFFSAPRSGITTRESLDKATREAGRRVLEGRIDPTAGIRRFITADGFGNFVELKDPKWDGQVHTPGEYRIVTTGGLVAGRTGCGFTMVSMGTNDPNHAAGIRLLRKGITADAPPSGKGERPSASVTGGP